MEDQSLGVVVASAIQRCFNCDYDLRGVSSNNCPECGAPRFWKRLAFLSDVVFRAAVHALEHERIDARVFDPRVGAINLPGFMGGQGVRGEILINAVEADRAVCALENAGIHVPVPIVDRAEPACPACEARVDPEGPAQCPDCGTVFQWIETEESVAETMANPTSATSESAGRVPRMITVLVLCALLAPSILLVIWNELEPPFSWLMGLTVISGVLFLILSLVVPRWFRKAQ
jgi:hypothetical protein